MHRLRRLLVFLCFLSCLRLFVNQCMILFSTCVMCMQWHAFEFVVVCTGKFGDVPRIPTFPANKGPELFKGKVMHSMDYCKLNKEEASHLLRGKKVAVIGYKKSAIDLALESALANHGTYIYFKELFDYFTHN